MSKFNKFNYLAVGFVVGLGLALLFLVWSVPEFSGPNHQNSSQIRKQEQKTEKGAKEKEDAPQPGYIIKDFVKLEDSVAQWGMAFLSFIATLFSIWAVWLLRGSLEATLKAVKSANDAVDIARDANKIASETGQAQTRAYLSCHSAEFSFDKFYLNLKIRIQNTGVTPADKILVSGIVNCIDPDKMENAISTEVQSFIGSIEAGGIFTSKITFSHLDIGTKAFEKMCSGDDTFLIECRLKYFDVFEISRPYVFFLSPNHEAVIAADGFKTIRFGHLVAHS